MIDNNVNINGNIGLFTTRYHLGELLCAPSSALKQVGNRLITARPGQSWTQDMKVLLLQTRCLCQCSAAGLLLGYACCYICSKLAL